MEIFRGENIRLNPFKKKETGSLIGRFITDSLEYAKAAANKFPAIIKSAEIPKKTFLKSMELFDKSGQPTSNLTSRSNLGLLDKGDTNKLKINILKTLGVNFQNLTPLAIKGLNVLASLPVATLTMVLQSTPANSHEVNMTLEDFAKLNEGSTNVDKALPSEPKDI
jgi:hypothetical protein